MDRKNVSLLPAVSVVLGVGSTGALPAHEIQAMPKEAKDRPNPVPRTDEAVRAGRATYVRTRHAGYRISLQVRKRIEEFVGGAKSVGPMERPMVRGTDRVGWLFTFTAAAYNLIRMRTLLAPPYPA